MKDEKLYKGHYVIVFYEQDDDTFKYLFNNITEICKELGLDVNRKNMNKIQVDIYRSLRRSNHQTNLFRRQCLKVYIVDVSDDEIDE